MEAYSILYSRIFIFAMVILPPIVIYAGVSQFRRGPSSDSLEYGFTLAWLWTGQTIGFILGWSISFIIGEFEKMNFKVPMSLWRPFLLSLAILASASPAVGGYIEVGKMLKDYGNCQQLN